jgi:hypothetical protein
VGSTKTTRERDKKEGIEFLKSGREYHFRTQ